MEYSTYLENKILNIYLFSSTTTKLVYYLSFEVDPTDFAFEVPGRKKTTVTNIVDIAQNLISG